MATMLIGHGAVRDGQRIRVPADTSITFLIDSGRVMPFTNGVHTVLNPETLEAQDFVPSSRHDAGDEIDNHVIAVLNSDQRAWYAQVDPEDGTCHYAGEQFPEPVRLCEDPGPDGACWTSGEHTCSGLLGRDWPDRDLVWVSCRQGKATVPQRSVGPALDDQGEEREASEQEKAALAAVDLLTGGHEQEFEQWWDTLDDDARAPYLTKDTIRAWVRQRQAREWLADGTTEADFWAFLNGHSSDEQQYYLARKGLPKEPTDLIDANRRGHLEYRQREARTYLTDAGPENFRLWVSELSDLHRGWILKAADLATAFNGSSGGGPTASERFGMTVDEIDWAVVQATNEAVLKAASQGEAIPYWQRPSGELLIGNDQPVTYRRLLEFERDASTDPSGSRPLGAITVTARGSGLSSGSLSVSGPCRRDTVQSWIGAFSKKKVTFTP